MPETTVPMRKLAGDLLNLLYPSLCLICRRPLIYGEQYLCTHCLQDMPRTQYHELPFNPMEQLFAGKIPVERCSSYFYFTKMKVLTVNLYTTSNTTMRKYAVSLWVHYTPKN